MKKIIVVVAAGTLVTGCAEGPAMGYAVQDEETAIRIGVDACLSSWAMPPRKDLYAKYRAGKWRVWWGNKDGSVVTFTVNVDAATGSAGPCAVGTN